MSGLSPAVLELSLITLTVWDLDKVCKGIIILGLSPSLRKWALGGRRLVIVLQVLAS